jgi:hypothetical protein
LGRGKRGRVLGERKALSPALSQREREISSNHYKSLVLSQSYTSNLNSRRVNIERFPKFALEPQSMNREL